MKSIISIWILILIGVISIVIPKTIMSLLTEQSTSRGMQRHKMFDRRVYFDRTLLTTHIVVTRAIGMRWGNNENETSKNKMQMLTCKILIRVKPDKYIHTSLPEVTGNWDYMSSIGKMNAPFVNGDNRNEILLCHLNSTEEILSYANPQGSHHAAAQ